MPIRNVKRCLKLIIRPVKLFGLTFGFSVIRGLMKLCSVHLVFLSNTHSTSTPKYWLPKIQIRNVKRCSKFIIRPVKYSGYHRLFSHSALWIRLSAIVFHFRSFSHSTSIPMCWAPKIQIRIVKRCSKLIVRTVSYSGYYFIF